MQDLEHAKNFGFTSNPPAGSDCVVVPLGGKTSHGIIITITNSVYRTTGLVGGETAVYSTDNAKMVLKKGRVIKISCEALDIKVPGGVNIGVPNVGCITQITTEGQIGDNGGMAVKGGSGTSFTGNVKMVGDSDTTGKLTNNSESVGSDHKHTGDSGGATSNPLQFRRSDIRQTKPQASLPDNEGMDALPSPQAGDYVVNQSAQSIENELCIRLVTPLGSYWADRALGSRLYELRRQKHLKRIEVLTKQYAEQALQPVIQSKRAQSVQVTTSAPQHGQPKLHIEAVGAADDTVALSHKVAVIWRRH